MSWLAGLALLKRGWAWLAGLPWYAIAIAVLVLIAGIERWQVVGLRADVAVRDAALKAVRAAQDSADHAAHDRQRQAVTVNQSNNQKVSHDYAGDVADRDRALAALRVRIAALDRAAGRGAVPGAGSAAGRADDPAGDQRLSLTDEATLRGQCQADADQLGRLIDWVAGRAEVTMKLPD